MTAPDRGRKRTDTAGAGKRDLIHISTRISIPEQRAYVVAGNSASSLVRTRVGATPALDCPWSILYELHRSSRSTNCDLVKTARGMSDHQQ